VLKDILCVVAEALHDEGYLDVKEAFRATDTKLKRQVAIKILPTSLAADHARLARFQREKEVLASLNHPHIAGIYGLSRSGSPVARSRSIMQHRPGETRR